RLSPACATSPRQGTGSFQLPPAASALSREKQFVSLPHGPLKTIPDTLTGHAHQRYVQSWQGGWTGTSYRPAKVPGARPGPPRRGWGPGLAPPGTAEGSRGRAAADAVADRGRTPARFSLRRKNPVCREGFRGESRMYSLWGPRADSRRGRPGFARREEA